MNPFHTTARGGDGRQLIAGGAAAGVGCAVIVFALRRDHLGIADTPGVTAWEAVLAVAGSLIALAGAWVLARAMRDVGTNALRASRVVPVLIALLVYGGAFALTESRITPRGDEPHYMLEAYSLALDHDRNLANDYADPRRFAPLFGRFVASVHAFNYKGDKGVAISWHGVGLPLLLLPAAVVSRNPSVMRITMVVIAALAAYLLLSLLTKVAGRRSKLVYAVWAVTAFSAPLLTYSTQVYPELPGALLLLLALRLLVEPDPGPRVVALISLVAGLLPWLHFRFGLLSLAIVGALLVRQLPRARAGDRVRTAALAAGPFLASAVLMAIEHQRWYGSPSPTAPTRLQVPRPHFDISWAYSHSLGGLLDPSYGWLPYAPLHLLAFVALVYLMVRGRRWAVAAGAIALFYLALVGSAKPAGGGFVFPGRYQIILVPLAAVPLLCALRESRVLRLVAVPLGLLTLAFSVESIIYIDRLVPGPSKLPISDWLSPLWPDMAPVPGVSYPHWPHAAAIVLIVLAAGSLLAYRNRTQNRALAPAAGPG